MGSSQTILDVGFSVNAGSDGYENALEHAIRNIGRVTGLTIDDLPDESPFPGMTIVQYDGGTFPFEYQEFDICWSNAVLEHVGSEAAMVEFLKETKRVGKCCFVTTPNRWFPVEPHTKLPIVHFLPKPVFDRFLVKVGRAWAAGTYMDLLGERRFRRVLDEAGVEDYTIHKNRFGPFTMDFVAIFRN